MIAVVGSNNVDLVLTVEEFTKPGETQSCLSFERFAGGKGANQAVACKKLGGEVLFLTCVGSDGNGDFSYNELAKADVKELVVRTQLSNGFAMIEITKRGENRIIIYPGSNAALTPELLREHTNELLKAQILLLQNEISFSTTFEAAKLFKENEKTVIFDPAPAHRIDLAILKYVDFVTPNETELLALTGSKDPEDGARILLEKGCKNVIVKMGDKGCLLLGELGKMKIGAFKVDAIDSTAAGDIFNAAFAVEFEKAKDVEKAMIFASAAAAISVTKKGAQSSIPTRSEVIEFLRERGKEI
ncbi:ribokinase [Pseudothermotoga sp. U03pept]|uniref:ribokinase n=1 Tax=Pseudothermotoga sp. U03pept TaxID=3447012 RepID=UPI003EFCC251